MPKMGGIERRKKINEDEEVRKKSIPFIYLTTIAGPPAMREAYEMCVQAFFKKAVTL